MTGGFGVNLIVCLSVGLFSHEHTVIILRFLCVVSQSGWSFLISPDCACVLQATGSVCVITTKDLYNLAKLLHVKGVWFKSILLQKPLFIGMLKELLVSVIIINLGATMDLLSASPRVGGSTPGYRPNVGHVLKCP